MQLYSALPATNYSWTTTSIDSLKRLQGPKQRLELARLAAFTLIELSLHVAATVAKFSAAVIQVPVYPLIGGVTPRLALVDASAHFARSAKLTAVLFAAPVVGLARPEWAVGLYQKLALVKEPSGRFGSVCRLAAAVLAGSALVAAGLAIRSRYFGSAPQSWLRIPLWAGITGGGVGALAVCALVVRCVKARRIDQLGKSRPVHTHTAFLAHGEVLAMRIRDNGTIYVLQGNGAERGLPVLRSWTGEDRPLSVREDVTAFTVVLNTAGCAVSNDSSVTCMETFADGSVATGYSSGAIIIQEGSPSSKITEIPAVINRYPITALAKLKCGNHVAALRTPTGSEMRVVFTGSVQGGLEIPGSNVSILEESPNGFFVAFNGPRGSVMMWAPYGSLDSPALYHEGTYGSEVTAIKWLSNEILLTGDNHGFFRLWDVPSGKLLSARRDHTGAIYAIKRTADGAETSSYDGQTRGWTIKLKEG